MEEKNGSNYRMKEEKNVSMELKEREEREKGEEGRREEGEGVPTYLLYVHM